MEIPKVYKGEEKYSMKITPFQLERYFAKYEFHAPYLLCSSDCESFTIGELLNYEPDVMKDFQKQWLGYTESLGNPELRREISKLYDGIGEEQILVHSGAEEAIFIFMNVVLEAGDHVLVHFPCYQSLMEIARSIGCQITKWEAKEEENWELDVDFLEKNIRQNTKAIIINCPHNPTGYIMDREKVSRLVEIARRNNIYIFSDEVYRFLEYKEEDRMPAFCDQYENAVSVGVMSKTFGLAGLRIGWSATKNREIYSKMAAFKDYTTICNSAPSEFLSIIALRNKEKIIQRNLHIIQENLKSLNAFFDQYQDVFHWRTPKAGSIAFPSIKINMTSIEFCRDLIAKKGVLLAPGKYFGSGYKNFRIGFGRKNLPVCLEKLEEYIVEAIIKS